MKRLLPESDYPENGKRRFSKSELEAVMEREIQKAVHSNNSRLQILTETIQQLQHEIDYGSTMQKLEARIETIKRRAKAALAAAETKKKRSVKDSEIINIDSDDNSMPETIDKRKKKTNYLIEIMESTTSSLKRIQAGNTAVMSALENLCKAASPPPQRQMPEEHPSQPNISGVQQAPAQQDEPPYPPLPLNAFPSVLNMEAASYNIPEKVKVHLALIKHPATLSVMWNLDEEDASPPPMESYSIFITSEKVKGSQVFPAWKKLGTVVAKSLPMCVAITKYRSGHRLCVAVVGKDIYGRYGPYSDVVSHVIPE
ncbi:activating transcription factor 7-interacting protein 2 isoform X3 [Entelurus aequoreus]|uniref:activating transcription factor 7-interacting protein 2 isoform X3 n=1 Tax=Entelurus aequoreus TaxID=161455 RepID=UPI002B1E5541|nr:activating transcription factor 7-interacting protein 2 isoform X3 [Entelurus aequoreus]